MKCVGFGEIQIEHNFTNVFSILYNHLKIKTSCVFVQRDLKPTVGVACSQVRPGKFRLVEVKEQM